MKGFSAHQIAGRTAEECDEKLRTFQRRFEHSAPFCCFGPDATANVEVRVVGKAKAILSRKLTGNWDHLGILTLTARRKLLAPVSAFTPVRCAAGTSAHQLHAGCTHAGTQVRRSYSAAMVNGKYVHCQLPKFGAPV
jgi:hypothetical protein